MLVLAVSTPVLSRFGLTLNQAAPARVVVSPVIDTDVSSAPQMLPPMYCVCCIRSSSALSMLVEPFCCAPSGLLYDSEVRTILDRVGMPPFPTAARLVMAQTPMRLSPVPLGSSEFKKNSAGDAPLVRAG